MKLINDHVSCGITINTGVHHTMLPILAPTSYHESSQAMWHIKSWVILLYQHYNASSTLNLMHRLE